jgi:hypothetical protein
VGHDYVDINVTNTEKLRWCRTCGVLSRKTIPRDFLDGCLEIEYLPANRPVCTTEDASQTDLAGEQGSDGRVGAG